MVSMECIHKMVSCCGKREFKRYLFMLAITAPISIILDLSNVGGLFLFIASCGAIIPLAGIIGEATERVAMAVGPKAGGFLNATMGNTPELFIGIFSVKAGLFSLVKASVIGSITGNMLLVLGFSILFGGMRYKFQSFDKAIARTNFGLLFLALIGFIIPAAYKYLGTDNSKGLTSLSLGIAVVFLVIYILGLFFSFYTHRNIFVKSGDGITQGESIKGVKRPVFYLILSTALMVYEASLLVGSIKAITSMYNISEAFLGIIIVPIIGNIAEYTSAIIMALKDKINLSIEIAIGSGMQMALFVAPVLVLVSMAIGNPMNYVFTFFELITITCSIGLSLYIFQDGKTNWLEGVELLSAYIIMALAYLLL